MKNLLSIIVTVIFLSIFSHLPAFFGESVNLYRDHNEYQEGSNCSFVIDDSQLYAVYSSADRYSGFNRLQLVTVDLVNLDFETKLFSDHTDTIRFRNKPRIIINREGNLQILYNSDYIIRLLELDRSGTEISSEQLPENNVDTPLIALSNNKQNILVTERDLEHAPHFFTDQLQRLDGTPGGKRFYAEDIINGRLHTNSDIWIAENNWPTFHGLVTTGGNVRVYPDGGNDFPEEEIFLGGLIENFDNIEIKHLSNSVRATGAYPLGSTVRDDAIAHVTLEGSTYTIMLGEVTVDQPQNEDDWIEGVNQFTIYSSYPPYGIIGDSLDVNRMPQTDTTWLEVASGSLTNSSAFIPMELWISGEVSGRQTWGSSHDIYIKDDITYTNTQPGLRADGIDENGELTLPVNQTDMFGLISEKSIYIQYGHYCPVDNIRKRPNTENIYLYGAFYALGQGVEPWQDGVFSFQYQYPKGSTPLQYVRGEYHENIDLHLFHYPTTVLNPWPPGLDYPWYNPLWPEPGPIYDVPGLPANTPNPHEAPSIVKDRGELNLFGSIIQTRQGDLNRSGTEDYDTGMWDIDNSIEPDTPPQYGSSYPDGGFTGYEAILYPDNRFSTMGPVAIPSLFARNPDNTAFHYYTIDKNGNGEPHHILTKQMRYEDDNLLIDTNGKDVAIITGTELLIFPDESEEYEKHDLQISENAFIKETIFVEDHLYLLAITNNQDGNYNAELLVYNIPQHTLNHVDSRIKPNMMQTIHRFYGHILWASVENHSQIIIDTYRDGEHIETVSWNHQIDWHENYDKEKSGLILGSEDQELTILVYLKTPEGRQLHLATETSDFTAIEDEFPSEELTGLTVTNYPNPISRNRLINGELINISFNIPQDSKIGLDIFNIKGQHLRTITSDHFNAGSHNLFWDGRDSSHSPVSSGVYFFRIKTEKQEIHSKTMIIK